MIFHFMQRFRRTQDGELRLFGMIGTQGDDRADCGG